MDNNNLLIIIFSMALVMFSLRALPMTFMKKEIQNNFLKSFLNYIPFTVFASMTIPEVFSSTSSGISATVGVIIAFILAYFEQDLLIVLVSSVVGVFIVENLFHL